MACGIWPGSIRDALVTAAESPLPSSQIAGACTATSMRKGAKWAPGLCALVGSAIKSWIANSREERERRKRERDRLSSRPLLRKREFSRSTVRRGT